MKLRQLPICLNFVCIVNLILFETLFTALFDVVLHMLFTHHPLFFPDIFLKPFKSRSREAGQKSSLISSLQTWQTSINHFEIAATFGELELLEGFSFIIKYDSEQKYKQFEGDITG